MGNQVSLVPKVSYEDIQMVVYRNINIAYSVLLINTLPERMQHCLIQSTIDFRQEEQIINDCITNNPNIMIIVYGKNSNDITILHKYEQLVKLGFTNVYIYTGGIFEWLILHEIYGKDLFKIKGYERDHLRYRTKSLLLQSMAQGYNFGAEPGYTGGGGGSVSGNIPFIENNTNGYKPDIAINIPMQTKFGLNERNHRGSNGGSHGGSDVGSDSGSESGSGSDSDKESQHRHKKKKDKSSGFSIIKWLLSK
jgi:hypothetical protein